MRQDWVTVDLDGLAQTMGRRGKNYVISELLSNALDEPVTRVDLTLTPAARGRAILVVEDDSPDGFRDLADSYTLFAPSYKKNDPSKAGRFNAGEKFALALAEWATIESTTGRVAFGPKGRTRSRRARAVGTRVEMLLRMTLAEQDEALRFARTLLLPSSATVTLNGEVLPSRTPAKTVTATLLTDIADDTGVLRRVRRDAALHVYDVLGNDGAQAWLYELGVPVVEIDGPWHVDVRQKVPLTLERDNVPPSYRARVYTLVLNAMAGELTKPEAHEAWVRQAAGSPDAEPAAVARVLDLRFGDRRVAYDPSDPEANKLAVSRGYTVVPGGALTAGEWANAKRDAVPLIRPAGQVTPSPKPFSADGSPLRLCKDVTPTMQCWAEWAGRAYNAVSENGRLSVRFADDRDWRFVATFGSGELTVNVAALGRAWFTGATWRWLELLIHEFGHGREGDHLSSRYHEALCEIGAKLAVWYAAEGLDLRAELLGEE